MRSRANGEQSASPAHSSRPAARLAMTSSTVLRTLRSLLAFTSVPLAPALVLSAAGLLGACRSPEGTTESPGQPVPPPSAPVAVAAAAQPREEAAPEPIGRDRKFPGSVLVFDKGSDGNPVERWLPASAAEEAGYTIVDLTNDWTPFLFERHVDAEGQALPNRYRRVFIGLANDQLDGDGQPLEAGTKNYLELYG